MLRTAICHILLLFAFSTVAHSKSVHHEDSEDYQKPQCDSDSDCPKGSFCYKDDNIYSCSPCSQCERYNRQKSNFFDCPTKAAQCGDCIPGFHADKDTEGNVVETCLPDHITAQGNDYMNIISLSILGGVAIAVLLLGVLIYAVFKHKRCHKVDGDQSETMSFCPPPSAPPPYPSVIQGETLSGLNASRPPFECEIDIKSEGPLSYEGHHVECEIEKPVQAVCFKFPNYVSQGPLDQDQEEADGPVHIPNPPDIHDETTQPSSWRPSEETNDERRKDNLGSEPRAALNEEVQATTDNIENSTEEQRHFSVISSGAECSSPQSIASSSSNVDNNNESPETRSKKRKIPSPELSSFNFNIYINNTAANLNENNNVVVSGHAQQNGRKRRNDISMINDHESD